MNWSQVQMVVRLWGEVFPGDIIKGTIIMQERPKSGTAAHGVEPVNLYDKEQKASSSSLESARCCEIGYLVPSFNHARYVVELLESIRCDAEKLNISWEIVIIDDGSSDDSQKVIKDWVARSGQGDKTRVICRENRGLAATLNQLIHETRAECLRLCASDDRLVPGSTARMLALLNSKRDLICIAGDGIVINENSEVISRSSVKYHGGNMTKLLSPQEMPSALVRHWCLAGPSLLIRRSHYKKMRYDERLGIDDFDLFLSLLAIPGSLAFIEEPVCHYRVHRANTSKTKNVEKRIRNLKAFNTIIRRYVRKRIMVEELICLGLKTEAKIALLERNYLRCALTILALVWNRARAMLKK